MIETAKFRFGLVGAGAIAQTYAQAFDGCDEAELVAVADIRSDAAESLAERIGGASFPSVEAMCDGVPLDAAIVCTPPVTHPELCLCLFDRKLHVLCEKPLAIDSGSVQTMIAAADSAGVKFTMASKFRCVEDVIRAREIVTSGALGDIILFENVFASHVDMSKRWNSDPKISGGGVLIDNGTHSVDIMRYFLGPLAELQVVQGKRVQKLPVEDTVRIFVRSQSSVLGSIDLSWSLNKELDSYINIFGSAGTLSVGWNKSKYRLSSDNEWVVFGKGYHKVQAFHRQITNFARAIRSTEELLITPDDALASVEVIETAYRSLRQNNWHPVRGNGSPAPREVDRTADLTR